MSLAVAKVIQRTHARRKSARAAIIKALHTKAADTDDREQRKALIRKAEQELDEQYQEDLKADEAINNEMQRAGDGEHEKAMHTLKAELKAYMEDGGTDEASKSRAAGYMKALEYYEEKARGGRGQKAGSGGSEGQQDTEMGGGPGHDPLAPAPGESASKKSADAIEAEINALESRLEGLDSSSEEYAAIEAEIDRLEAQLDLEISQGKSEAGTSGETQTDEEMGGGAGHNPLDPAAVERKSHDDEGDIEHEMGGGTGHDPLAPLPGGRMKRRKAEGPVGDPAHDSSSNLPAGKEPRLALHGGATGVPPGVGKSGGPDPAGDADTNTQPQGDVGKIDYPGAGKTRRRKAGDPAGDPDSNRQSQSSDQDATEQIVITPEIKAQIDGVKRDIRRKSRLLRRHGIEVKLPGSLAAV